MEELIQTESKPLSTRSVFSFIPPRRTELKERSYFNSSPQVADGQSVFLCPLVVTRIVCHCDIFFPL